MERKLAIFVILILVILTSFSVGISMFYPDLHGEILAYYGLEDEEEKEVFTLVENKDYLMDKKGNVHNMRLEFPLSSKPQRAVIENDLFNRKLKITAEGIGKGYPGDYPLTGDRQNIKEVNYKNNRRTGEISILFDKSIECESLVEGQFLYLDFLTPREKYEKVFVIDAGHGGSDTGAVFKDDFEKDINLEIALGLKEALNKEGIGVYLTRESDSFLSPQTRADYVNGIEPDLFLSIHLNSTSSGRESDIYGSEVMYYSKEESGKSKELARKLSKVISEALEGRDRGVLVGDDIYVLREIKTPAVLCELGFITNPYELEKIKSKDYQKRIIDKIAETVLEEIK